MYSFIIYNFNFRFNISIPPLIKFFGGDYNAFMFQKQVNEAFQLHSFYTPPPPPHNEICWTEIFPQNWLTESLKLKVICFIVITNKLTWILWVIRWMQLRVSYNQSDRIKTILTIMSKYKLFTQLHYWKNVSTSGNCILIEGQIFFR